MRHCFAMAGYGDGFSVLDRSKEFGQVRLSLCRLNLTHVLLQPVVLTIPSYPLLANHVKVYSRPATEQSSRFGDKRSRVLVHLCFWSAVAIVSEISGHSQSHPKFKDGSAYRQLRPTRLDKIKNFPLVLQTGPVVKSISLSYHAASNGARQSNAFVVMLIRNS